MFEGYFILLVIELFNWLHGFCENSFIYPKILAPMLLNGYFIGVWWNLLSTFLWLWVMILFLVWDHVYFSMQILDNNCFMHHVDCSTSWISRLEDSFRYKLKKVYVSSYKFYAIGSYVPINWWAFEQNLGGHRAIFILDGHTSSNF